MSREAYQAEARAIVQQAQQEGDAAMRALYEKHQQIMRQAVDRIAASAAKNGVRPNIQANVNPTVRQVLVAPRVPVYLFTYL